MAVGGQQRTAIAYDDGIMITQPLTLPRTPPVRDAAIAALRQLRGELGLLGVTNVWLFGSVARGDDTEHSDVDVAVQTVDVVDWLIDADVRDLLESALGREVDVAAMPLYGPVASTAPDEMVPVSGGM